MVYKKRGCMLSKLYYKLLFNVICCWSVTFADTVSSALQIDSGAYPFATPPVASFNPQTQQFLVSFLASNSYASLYDVAGNLKLGPVTILNAEINPVPFSAPVSCYNSLDNQFLLAYVGWHSETSTYFSIVDANINTIVGPVELINPDYDLNSKIVSCCYNSVDNQYLITWTTACGYAYFVILDALGNIVVDRTEIDGVSVIDGRGVYVSYNSVNNQYLFTWQDASTNYPYCAIYDASASLIVAPTIINDSTVCYATFVTSAYNSINNQYMVVWNDTSDNAYCVILDASGSIVTPLTLIAAYTVNKIGGGGLSVSYNPEKNEYFMSWNGDDGTIYYTVYDDQGMVKIPVAHVVVPGGSVYYNVLKYTTCATGQNIYWFGWLSSYNDVDSKGYFALYRRIVYKPSVQKDYIKNFTSAPLNITKPTNSAGFLGSLPLYVLGN